VSLYLDDDKKRNKNTNYQLSLLTPYSSGVIAEFRMTLPPVSARSVFSADVKIK